MQQNNTSLIIESLMLADRINPIYVYLKQCFDKLKKYKFEIITVENPNKLLEDRFQSNSFFNGRQISCGMGKSKKESKIQCSLYTIDILAQSHPDILQYFLNLPKIKQKFNNLFEKQQQPQDGGQKKVKCNQNNQNQNFSSSNTFFVPPKQEKLEYVQNDVVNEIAVQMQDLTVPVHVQSKIPGQNNYEMIDDIYNAASSDVSKKASQLAKSLSINDQVKYVKILKDFNYYESFVEKFQAILQSKIYGANIFSIGSYTQEAMRNNRLELDLVIQLPDQYQIQVLSQVLQNAQNQLDIKEVDMNDPNRIVIVLNRIGSKNQDRTLYSQVPCLLQVILFTNLGDPQLYSQISHTLYMNKFTDNISANVFAQHSLILIRQWRDSSGIRLMIPIDILDFLVTQVTCKFTLIQQPFIILRQVIYLLQQDILSQILQPDRFLINPFITQITKLHYTLIFNLGLLKEQIKQLALKWDKIKLDQWVEEMLFQ